jgi:hypothetical protein
MERALDKHLRKLNAALARVAELEGELESHAWEISPAMAQAKIDQLNARVEELEDREKAIVHFCEVEMGWEYFRAEFGISKTQTQTEQNANKLRDYLKQHGGLPAQPPAPPHLDRPDKPGKWWWWDEDVEDWLLVTVTDPKARAYGKWSPLATPPPPPSKEGTK